MESFHNNAKSTLFVIEGEGVEISIKNSFFPEVMATEQLARENNCPIIDIISSFHDKPLTNLFKSNDPRRLKKIILMMLDLFAKFNDFDEWVSEKLIEPYKTKLGLQADYPVWLVKLKLESLQEAKDEIIKDLAGSEDLENFTNALKEEINQMKQDLDNLINLISANDLYDYLKNHPEIETVYALIGKDHLKILHLLGHVTSYDEHSMHATCEMNLGKTVHLHFFGGTHSKMDHYEKLAEFAKTQGLVVPHIELSTQNVSHKFFKYKNIDSNDARFAEFMKKFNALSNLHTRETTPELSNDISDLLAQASSFLEKIDPSNLSESNYGYLAYLQDEMDEILCPNILEHSSEEDNEKSEDENKGKCELEYEDSIQSRLIIPHIRLDDSSESSDEDIPPSKKIKNRKN